MYNDAQIISIVSLCASILIYVIALPGYFNKIKRNLFIGVRTTKSLKSDDAWYKINKYGSKILMLWTLIPVMVSLMILVLADKPLNEFLTFAPIFSLLIALICSLLQILIYQKSI